MSTNNDIQAEVQKTLQSLDNFERLSTKPFFFTRLKARMEKQAEVSWVTRLFDVPVLKPALASLIILINVFTVWQVVLTSNNATAKMEVIDTIVEEYALNMSSESIYDLSEE